MKFSRKHCVISVFSLFIIACLSSCEVTRPTGYFVDIKKDTLITVSRPGDDALPIKKGDELTIDISSLNKVEDEIFTVKSEKGYEVGKEGEIYIHRLGKMIAEGLTRKQLKARLEEDLKAYLKDPVVNIRFANHHITVVGDIGKAQVLQMPEEKLSIIDALALSGSISQTIALKNVVVLRDTGINQKLVKHLNLEDQSIFGTDYYYLKPNDVVVLNTNEKVYMQDQKRIKYQQVSSIVLQTVTIGLLIYQTFLR